MCSKERRLRWSRARETPHPPITLRASGNAFLHWYSRSSTNNIYLHFTKMKETQLDHIQTNLETSVTIQTWGARYAAIPLLRQCLNRSATLQVQSVPVYHKLCKSSSCCYLSGHILSQVLVRTQETEKHSSRFLFAPEVTVKQDEKIPCFTLICGLASPFLETMACASLCFLRLLLEHGINCIIL